ncbi:unnamed protein product [Chrysoparadoxa australica]
MNPQGEAAELLNAAMTAQDNEEKLSVLGQAQARSLVEYRQRCSAVLKTLQSMQELLERHLLEAAEGFVEESNELEVAIQQRLAVNAELEAKMANASKVMQANLQELI